MKNRVELVSRESSMECYGVMEVVYKETIAWVKRFRRARARK